jgi:hypothetical protein
MVIYARSINRDHLHMLIGIPPHVSVAGGTVPVRGGAKIDPEAARERRFVAE